MGWYLSVVVSIYERDAWCTGLLKEEKPLHEKEFRVNLPVEFTALHLSAAMCRAGGQAEHWLKKVKPDLIDQVTVVVYSLEVN